MAERDKIRELAENIGQAIARELGRHGVAGEGLQKILAESGFSNIAEGILRAGLKSFLDVADKAALQLYNAAYADERQHHRYGNRLAAELQGWRKE